MIIGIDATRANKAQKTGVEWYSYHLIRELAALKSEHTLRLYFRSEPEAALKNLGPNVQYRVLRWPLKYLWTQARLSFEMLINPPDLLFIPAQIIPLIHPDKTVTTIHDVAYIPYPESYTPQSRWYLSLAARLAKKLPLILTVSQFSRKEILKYYDIPANRIVVTPLGLSHEDRSGTGVLAKYNIRTPYILYVGRLERKKNIKTIVQSFDLIKQESWGRRFQLVLVGIKGYGWEEIEKTIQNSPNNDDIKTIGWVSESEKHTLFSEATVFTLLSAYEGFGLPLLEAMDAQTPIIASDQAALPEIAGDAAIMVPRGKALAVRDAVRDILFDTALRMRLIDAGSKRVKQFTWRITAEKTMRALEMLLARR